MMGGHQILFCLNERQTCLQHHHAHSDDDGRTDGPKGRADIVYLAGTVDDEVEQPRDDVTPKEPLRERQRGASEHEQQPDYQEERNVLQVI